MNWHDKQVKTYDQQISRKIAGYELLHDLTSHLLSIHSPSIQQMLIIGAGGGQELVSFSAHLPNCHFLALDSSKPMLARAKERTRHLNNSIDFVLADWADYEVTAQFNAASCLLVLNFIDGLEQKIAFINKIYHTLQPHAVLFISMMMKDAEQCMKLQLSAWKHYMQQQEISTEHATKFEKNYHNTYQLLQEDELISILTSCGFTSVSRYFQSFLLTSYVCIKQ
ncbi:class I SAM-dependent methyltransferase [Lysinibacillus louembei]|uniref:Class I SAM-dependent methyltransferase n=1 Tax=Lysinibacillus louembei TaxID=1470088 RepID=A0ABZ0RY93_9BACI|nr:class I SAM-dependent methyltransferase [Lysinibacillus louembei]WPK13110.1 class I SAM-dependent methyltransferase [Lysinibacillus louembei]